MATFRDVKHGDSIEVDIAVPDLEPIVCPLFTLMGTEWIFRFVKEITSIPPCGKVPLYRAYMKRNDTNSNAQFKPFRFSYRVDVIDKDGKQIKNLSEEKYKNLKISTFCFFNTYKTTLGENVPSNYSGWNVLKFSFTVYLPSEPVQKFKLKFHDKCDQKASYLNADTSVGSLSIDFSELLDSGLNHDVKLKCEEHTVKAHKLILCTRSKVFKTMLENNFLEGQTGVVEIPDMDSSSFLDFIKYIYTDILPELTFEKAMTLYEAGDKYDVRSLSMRCSDYLLDNLSPENVYRCLVLADAHSDEKLINEVTNYILNNKLDLQDDWLPFSENHPKIAFEVHRLSRKNITDK